MTLKLESPVAVLSNGTVRVWDVLTGKSVWSAAFARKARQALSPMMHSTSNQWKDPVTYICTSQASFEKVTHG